MNTRYIESEFDYTKPASLDEALKFLAEHENVKIYSGGTDLMVKLKEGSKIQMDYMLDINGIDELNHYEICEESGAKIGTGVRLSTLEKDPLVQKMYPGLYNALIAMASISVRNMASIGGNICNASPGADTAGPFICYGAMLELASVRGTRMLPVEEFFLGGSKTALAADEMLTYIHVPAPKADTGAAFIKLSRVKADLAKLSITCVLHRDGKKIDCIRMSMASLASTPLFLKDVCANANGKEFSEELLAQIIEEMSNTIKPRDGGNRTTGAYRKAMAPIITRDAVKQAWERSGGEF